MDSFNPFLEISGPRPKPEARGWSLVIPLGMIGMVLQFLTVSSAPFPYLQEECALAPEILLAGDAGGEEEHLGGRQAQDHVEQRDAQVGRRSGAGNERGRSSGDKWNHGWKLRKGCHQCSAH